MQIRNSTLLTAIASLALLIGCAGNPADDVPAASVGEPAEETTTLQEPADDSMTEAETSDESMADEDAADEMESNEVDEADPNAPMNDPAAETLDGEYPLYGNIVAVGSKVTRSHRMVFPEWTGSLVIQDGDLSTALIGFEVDIDSMLVDPGEEYGMKDRLETHLRSEDFFLVAEYPTATFSSTAISEGVAEGMEGTHTITGDMTIRGVTQQISFPATIMVTDGVATATAEFSVDRQNWDLSFPGSPDDLIRDEVVFQIGLTTDESMADMGGEGMDGSMDEGMTEEGSMDEESTEGEMEDGEMEEGEGEGSDG